MISKAEKFPEVTEISAERDIGMPSSSSLRVEIKATPRYMLLNASLWTVLLHLRSIWASYTLWLCSFALKQFLILCLRLEIKIFLVLFS